MKLFFHRSVFFDPDDIRRWPGYVKASSWSNLKVSNNGFLIFDDLGRKSGKMWESWQFCFLSWKWSFFFKNRKSMCRCEKIKNRYYEMKAHALNVFPNHWYDWKKWKMKKKFMQFFIKVFACYFYAIFYWGMHITLKNAWKLFFSEF